MFRPTRQRILPLLKKTDNKKGYSLLEVLISVTILAIIITPLLSIFTTSFQTTALSQDLLDGTFVAQSVYEKMLSNDYMSLLNTTTQKQTYDSNSDGIDDCFVQVNLYPDGVYSNFSGVIDPSYLHINVIGNDIILFGSSGTNDNYNIGTQIAASIEDITITNSDLSKTVQVQIGSYDTMTFDKKTIGSPLVVIINIFSKLYNSQDIELTLIGDKDNIHILEYARSKNFSELVSSDVLDSNIYFGVGDYTTTFLHAYVQVFDISDIDNRIGYIEDTFEVSLY